MQTKHKRNKPYQFEIKTVKLSECSPDDIRVKLAKKVLANLNNKDDDLMRIFRKGNLADDVTSLIGFNGASITRS